MITTPRLAVIALCLASASASWALTITQGYDVLSGVHSYGDGFNGSIYSATASRDFGEDPAYINDVQFDFGSGWHPSLSLNTDFQALTSGYTYGTEIGEGTTVSLNLAGLFSTVSASVPVGMYQFTASIIGGETDSSTDILAEYDYVLDVRETIDADLNSSISSNSVNIGETTTVSATLTNSGPEQIVSTLWFLYVGVPAGGDHPNPVDHMNFGFAGNWFNQAIDPGQSRTDLHSTFTPTALTPQGMYRVYGGIYYGYHEGDRYFANFDPGPEFEVVPEPATLVGLGTLVLAGLRRRKK